MKHLSLLALATLMSTHAFAGATNIELSCKSGSERTLVTASVPGDFAEHDLTFQIDGKMLNWADTLEKGANSSVQVLGSARAGDFKVYIWAPTNQKFDTRLFALEEIAGSQKIKRTANGEVGRFRARVQGVDPRFEVATESPAIEVSCSYDYEI